MMRSGADEFRQGWKTLLAATVGVGTGLTTFVFYTTGVFLPALSKEFGWRDSQIMAVVMIVLVGASLLGPLVGTIVDRLGARPVALWSVAGAAFGWAMLALTPPSLTAFYLLFGLLTVVGAGSLPLTWTRSVVAQFDRRRGLALGICMVGTGLFGSAIKLLAFHLLETFGWRLAYAGVGVFLLCVTLPLAWFFLPADKPARPANAAPRSGGGAPPASLKSWRLWLLAVAFLALSLPISGIAPNLERFLGHNGFGAKQAVEIAAFYGVGIVAGRLITGVLLDRFWAPAVVLVMLVPSVITFLALAQGLSSPVSAAVGVFMVGTAAGVEYDALAFLVSRYFGKSAYGVIYGAVYIGFAVGAGVGPLAFTRLAELGVSYPQLLVGSAILILVGAALLLPLGAYPPNDEGEAGTPPKSKI